MTVPLAPGQVAAEGAEDALLVKLLVVEELEGPLPPPFPIPMLLVGKPPGPPPDEVEVLETAALVVVSAELVETAAESVGADESEVLDTSTPAEVVSGLVERVAESVDADESEVLDTAASVETVAELVERVADSVDADKLEVSETVTPVETVAESVDKSETVDVVARSVVLGELVPVEVPVEVPAPEPAPGTRDARIPPT